MHRYSGELKHGLSSGATTVELRLDEWDLLYKTVFTTRSGEKVEKTGVFLLIR